MLPFPSAKWVEEWFVVVTPAPSVPPWTGLPPVLNEKWEEMPTEEEMVQVKILLAELVKLKAKKLTGATPWPYLSRSS